MDISILVKTRDNHETADTKRSIRQVGRSLSQVLRRKPAPVIAADPSEEDSPEVKRQLSAKLLDLISIHLRGSTAGIAREIRHTGTASGMTTEAKERNKALGDQAVAEVCRLKCFNLELH